MKVQGLVFLLLLVFTVPLIPGCINSNETVKMSDTFQMDNFSWYEYRSLNSKLGDMNGQVYPTVDYKLQFGSGYLNGTPAKHVSMVQSYGNISYVQNFYWNMAGDMMLGGNWSRFEDGKLILEQNYSGQQSQYQDNANLLFSAYWNQTLVKVGKDNLMLNGTQYNCDKYRWDADNHEHLLWDDPAVPVPLKIYVPDTNETLELINWG